MGLKDEMKLRRAGLRSPNEAGNRTGTGQSLGGGTHTQTKKSSSFLVYFLVLRPVEYAQWRFSRWPRPQDFFQRFSWLQETFTNKLHGSKLQPSSVQFYGGGP